MTNVQVRFADALQRSRCQCWSALGLCGWNRQATLCNGISVIFRLRQRDQQDEVINRFRSERGKLLL